MKLQTRGKQNVRYGANLLALTLLACLPLSAAQSFDRAKIPAAGKTPTLRAPAWTRTKLANGAALIVAEKRDLPLVSFTLTFLGGANQFDPPSRRGVGSLAASMLTEGTSTRNGDALSDALQLLGTTVNTTVGAESGSIGFVSTAGNFPATLNIVADLLMHATFPSDALERQRAQRLVALSQAKDRTAVIAGVVFPRTLFGDSHPYGRSITEKSIQAITRDDVVTFYKTYFQPGRALVTVVGDVTAASSKATIEQSLREWTGGGEKPSFTYPPLAAGKAPTTIYLVDKPGAAQSTFALGNPGPPRSTADYFAVQTMNRILGGQFQSRLNANIREEKGYSYGVSSSFAFGKGPGPFRAGGEVVTAKSDVALIEFVKELRGIQGARPITELEMKLARDGLIQRLPEQFASVTAINGALTTLWVEDLPNDYYRSYSKQVAAVTREDVVRVARRYIDLDHLIIVIVGDRAVIEGPLKAAGIAPVVLLDLDGNRIETR